MTRVGHTTFPEEMPKEINIIGIEVEDIFTLSRECTEKVKSTIPKAIPKSAIELKSLKFSK